MDKCSQRSTKYRCISLFTAKTLSLFSEVEVRSRYFAWTSCLSLGQEKHLLFLCFQHYIACNEREIISYSFLAKLGGPVAVVAVVVLKSVFFDYYYFARCMPHTTPHEIIHYVIKHVSGFDPVWWNLLHIHPGDSTRNIRHINYSIQTSNFVILNGWTSPKS